MTDPLSFPMESPLRWWKRREKLSAILVETGRTPYAVVWIEGNRQRVKRKGQRQPDHHPPQTNGESCA